MDGPAGRRIDAAPARGRRGEITRDDVAAVLALSLDEPATIGKTFGILNGATPIREALGGL